MDENARPEVVAALEYVVKNLKWSSEMTQRVLGPNEDFDAGTSAAIMSIENLAKHVREGGDLS